MQCKVYIYIYIIFFLLKKIRVEIDKITVFFNFFICNLVDSDNKMIDVLLASKNGNSEDNDGVSMHA